MFTVRTEFLDSSRSGKSQTNFLDNAAEVKIARGLALGSLTYHKLRNAHVLHARTVICNGEVYPSDLHNFSDGSWPTDSVFSRNQIDYIFSRAYHSERLDGTYVFLGSSTSWFHFLIEIFPRYLMLETKLIQTCVPVVETKTPTQILEVLALITDKTPIILSPGQNASFEILYACTESRYPLGLEIMNRKNDIRLVRKFFQDTFRLFATEPKRNILIKRNKNLFRYSAEIDFLAKICESLGFEIVDSGVLSMREQVDLFASAKLVIGETGSSLTNLLFCKPGTTVIEVNLHEFMPELFTDFCSVLDINHIVIDEIRESENTCHVSNEGSRQNIKQLIQKYC
jgi:capsular polysaccharide biosynthesis protein